MLQIHSRRQLRFPRARVKHILGFEFAPRQPLAMAIFEQLIDLGPRAAEAPEIRIGARRGLFFHP